jgi:hypothetical protein
VNTTLRVFDPPMCCATGVCGPAVDPELARFAADLHWLKSRGVAVERYNLSSEPGAFAEHAAVKEALGRGTAVLPLILVGDRVAVEGTYPSRETLAALAGVLVEAAPPEASKASTGCCGPNAKASKSGCC